MVMVIYRNKRRETFWYSGNPALRQFLHFLQPSGTSQKRLQSKCRRWTVSALQHSWTRRRSWRRCSTQTSSPCWASARSASPSTSWWRACATGGSPSSSGRGQARTWPSLSSFTSELRWVVGLADLLHLLLSSTSCGGWELGERLVRILPSHSSSTWERRWMAGWAGFLLLLLGSTSCGGGS